MYNRPIKANNYKQIKRTSINNAIDVIFSHNSRVAIWKYDEKTRESTRIWLGMAWELPKEYRYIVAWKIFGVIPESIGDADIINIRIL